MKTHEEIKKGMECMLGLHCEDYLGCDGCPRSVYTADEMHADQPAHDALTYIQQLENAVEFYSNTNQMLDAKITKLESRLAKVERERDAAEGKRMAEWISVNDRLPPYIGKKILVVNGHGNIEIMAFWRKDGYNWTWLDCHGHFNHTNDITHWMPLPKAPKKEEK